MVLWPILGRTVVIDDGTIVEISDGYDCPADREIPSCACSMRSTVFGVVADGPEAVRAAARHNLRDGSGFLKMHVSGGVATPSDPLESVQYTHEEIRIRALRFEH